MKRCTVCKTDKPLDQYNWRDKSKGWLKSDCRTCQKAASRIYVASHLVEKRDYKRRWRAADPEKHRAKNAAYYAAHKEHDAERHRAARQSHGDVLRARARAKYAENRTEMRRYLDEWQRKNKARVRSYARAEYERNKPAHFEEARRRRALKIGATLHDFSSEQLDARMSVFGYRCAYCGGPFQDVDHVKPLSRGGPHCLSNLRPSCEPCNSRKHAKDHKVWLARLQT